MFSVYKQTSAVCSGHYPPQPPCDVGVALAPFIFAPCRMNPSCACSGSWSKTFCSYHLCAGVAGACMGHTVLGGDLQERRQLSFFLFSEKRLMSGLPVRCGMESSKTLYVVAKLHTYD